MLYSNNCSSKRHPILTPTADGILAITQSFKLTTKFLNDHPEQTQHLCRLACSIAGALSYGASSDNIVHAVNRYAARTFTPDLYADFDRTLVRKIPAPPEAEFITLGHSHNESLYSMQDLIKINKAFELAEDLYRGVQRKWGPYETMPLFQHAAEVGIMLLACAEPADVVCGGILHDLFEHYTARNNTDILARFDQTFDPKNTKIKELVFAVTEPKKTEGVENWSERKLKVIENLINCGRDAASICCASKIATIASGNKFLFITRSLEGWSRGTIEQNATSFLTLSNIFKEKGVHPALLERFRDEFERFCSWSCSPLTLDQKLIET